MLPPCPYIVFGNNLGVWSKGTHDFKIRHGITCASCYIPESVSNRDMGHLILSLHYILLIIHSNSPYPLIRTPQIRALPSTGQGSRQNCLYIHTSWNSVAQLATAIMAALPEQLQGQLHLITGLGPRTPASCNYC